MQKFNRNLVIIITILISYACENIEIGLEPTLTSTATQNVPTLKTSQPVETPQIELTKTQAPTEVKDITYTHPDYGFSFQYLASWIINSTKNQIILSSSSAQLAIRFKYSDEEVSITKEIQPSITFIENGTVNFLTQTITRYTWVDNLSLLAVFYNEGKEIRVGNMVFSISLQSNHESSSTGISKEDEAQADQILSSFTATIDLSTSKCTDKAVFLQDVTVLDDTRFSPGEGFIKTWRLQNAGTCTWTTEYALIYLDGDQMTGNSPKPLPGDVIPGQTIDLSIDLIAPASSGTYRGNWMLMNDNGEKFGLGLDGDKPFWVQITVGETTPDIRDTLGDPDFTDSLITTNNWFLLETSNVKFSSDNGVLLLTSSNPGINDEWGLANISPLRNIYLELTFSTLDSCSGLDRYGVIVRAPDPNQGYVYGFSCDGRFRLYKWDGTRYQPIQEWKSSPQIKDGPNQTNRLGIYLLDDQIQLYANGQLISEYTDTTFSEGRFGVFIGADQTTNFQVTLDEAVYWKLEN